MTEPTDGPYSRGMRTLTWLVMVLAALAFGCAGGGDEGASDEPVSSEDTSGAAEPGDDTAGPAHCEGGFVAGVGGPDQVCAAMIGGCCYESTDDACDTLNCSGRCIADETMPAQVHCE